MSQGSGVGLLGATILSLERLFLQSQSDKPQIVVALTGLGENTALPFIICDPQSPREVGHCPDKNH